MRTNTLATSVLFILSIAVSGDCAPSISSVDGTVSLGSSITISGSSFGSHSLQIDSLQSTIESGTVGQELSKSGWTRSDWGGWADPLYANDYAHSGTKSIKCSPDPVTNYNCAFAYDMPNVTTGQRFYASWWTRYTGSSAGQWKMFRASGPLTIVDGPEETYIANWFEVQQMVNVNPGGPGAYTYWLGGLPDGSGTWYRVELDWVASSAGSSDGSLTIRVTNDSGVINTWTQATLTHYGSSDSWDYAIWQNYVGNGTLSGTVNIWFDDIYVQYNTPARVELCSGSTWANRGKCEIQIPTAWSTTSISATANTGNFTNGSTAYLYAVDSDGTANSSGYTVEVGGGSITGGSPINTGATMRVGSGATRIYPVQ